MIALTEKSLLEDILPNKRRAHAFYKLGVRTIGDALTYYPFRVTRPVPRETLKTVKIGNVCAVLVTIDSVQQIQMHSRQGYRLIVLVHDADDPRTSASLVFFTRKRNYVSWLMKKIIRGHTAVICGEPTVYNGTLQFAHPSVDMVTETQTADMLLSKIMKPRPVYHATARFSSETIHETILNIIKIIRASENMETIERIIPTILPPQCQKYFTHKIDALQGIHDPQTVDQFYKGLHELRFEEALVSQASLLLIRQRSQKQQAYSCPQHSSTGPSLYNQFLTHLPFTLTQGQQNVIATIAHDLEGPAPMRRLLQGDVGSGKTVIAFLTMLQAVQNGYQAALIAPTQVLAEQHYDTLTQQLKTILGDQAPDIILLTGALRLHEHREALARIASGKPCFIIATHAAFSRNFTAPQLALVVIDEQHRFGVEQRNTLEEKSLHALHLLIMTATPIPRTAAMTLFGDLDISELTELPAGRQPITTTVIPEANNQLMARMFLHCRNRLQANERIYIVCPAIHTNDDEATTTDTNIESGTDLRNDTTVNAHGVEVLTSQAPLHSVDEMYHRLSALPQFNGIQLAHLTGQDDAATKTRVMQDFANGITPVLVATTVVEVGVNVPEASCIIIFNADRFGLSQLHQLRGRVGRGRTCGWAFLVSNAEPDSLAAQRLDVLVHTTRGVDVAEADITMRGIGDVLGTAQAGGKTSLKLLRVITDKDMIKYARSCAQQLLTEDPQLHHYPQLMGAALDFMLGNEKFLTRS